MMTSSLQSSPLRSLTLRSSTRALVIVALLALPLALSAAERVSKNAAAGGGEPAQTVEMFAAIKSQEIEVSFVPKDSSEARVVIRNKTKKPLNVKLPDAFAGMPVLAQRGGIGAPGGRGGQQGGMGGMQGMGGGMGGMGGGMGMGGMGMGGGGMGMGMMNIAPEKVAQFKVPCVCLEHGKKEPRSSVPYEIKPIEALTTKPEVKQLLIAFGKRQLNQSATQAAAWHLANGMSWDALASKQREHLGGSSEPWFNPLEIQTAMQISQYAAAQAQAEARQSPGDSASRNTASTSGN
jgi:hypothetical protein